ncbi:MAG: hypothetical protein Tsb0013_17630 [Phycisphaerales bacterium]
MTERNMNIDPSQLNDAARLRALADGEIPRERAGEVDDRRLAFESALKDSVARVMGEDVRAPEALRASVAAMFAAEHATEHATEDVPDVLVAAGVDTTDRSFWSGGAGRWLPIAAVLALVITLVGVGASSFLTPQTVNSQFTVTRASNVIEFVPSAHTYTITCDPATFAEKFTQVSIDDAVTYAGTYLGGVTGDLRTKLVSLDKAGFRFVGMGPCAVPGEGKSVHAYFEHEATGTGVSVFIQQLDEPGFDKMCEKHCFGASCEDGAAKNLYVWKCSGYLHYLYSPDAEVTESARAAMDAPSKVASLMP